jgi:hypothetical protein
MGGGTMNLDDYLQTRLVEIVVHDDDLAMSVGLPTNIPAEAISLAVDHLFAVARLQHGDLAVLRAFARRERDESQALRVF